MIVEFEIHAVVNLIVHECDVVLEDGVPFLEHNAFPIRAGLSGYELLQVANRVVRIAFDAHLFAQSIVANDLDHDCF